MLYLFGMRHDSCEINLVAVDCFNDVTGIDESFCKLWDVQSKNHSSLPPSIIGESLSTLYDNFISSISFYEYILFIPKLNREYLEDPSLNTYGYNNIKAKQKKGIEKKLKEKINGNKSNATLPLFDDFLNKVTFVEDNKNISTYIKVLSGFKKKRAIPESVYNNIFVEIRNAQSSLKNSYIENESIAHQSDVIKFNRHITKSQINTLLISRLIGIDDIFSFGGIPVDFLPYVSGMDVDDTKDLKQECNENLSRAFFDKNGCKEFWLMSEKIIEILKNKPTFSVADAFDELVSHMKIKTVYLNEKTIQYMISLVKTGLDNAN